MGVVAPITMRVNPDVDARTHEKIATGKKENKFGIPIARARAVYAEAARLPGHRVVGIDVHIGSQLTELEPFEAGLSQGGRPDRRCAPMATGSPAGSGRRPWHPLHPVERGAAAAVWTTAR
jgi:hypothetical protein